MMQNKFDLETLFEKQKQLDDYIIKKKGLDTLPKQELLNNTVLALQVEICELANEWRGFKHWSEDREPRSRVKVHCELCGPEDNPKYTREDAGRCPNCCTGVISFKNPLLEEYVDCLHFFLSIAWQIGLTADDLFVDDEEYETPTNVAFTILLYLVSSVNGKCFLINPPDIKLPFRLALYIFFSLGYQRFGFTWDEITQAYIDKWQINMQRQESGY
ncbi:dUTP diphosphatase [Brevibacillus laterosporus]|uniref:dUTP diphosphatase n=1 Tax=Brevibacillus laterosporus TaxID=1465 RepID=UPI002E22F9A2|nr:dUTP diphosphatase [Brevibacillus laterosporus]MED1670312.1 dUTP diphosphatase [Brevibacillus laterosporus]MED1717893.1 dUTP diphosphatase [Brevibacillus laterosporus]